jgi:hypothetical protein
MEIQPQWSRLVGGKLSTTVQTFMATDNKNRLHQLIVDTVYRRTSGSIKISRQSDTQLTSIMLRVAQSNENMYRSKEQLNEITVNECVSSVLQNVSHYLHYVRQMQENTGVMQRPMMARETKEMSMPALM